MTVTELKPDARVQWRVNARAKMSSGAAQAIPPPLNNNASADSLHFAFLPTPLCDDLMFR